MKLRIFIFSLVLLFASLGAYAKTSIKTIKPHNGKIQATFTELAKTYLEDIYTINVPFSGKVELITLQANDKVNKGQVVAKMDQIPLNLDKVGARAELKAFKIFNANQLRNVDRAVKLDKKGFVSKTTLDTLEALQQAVYAWIGKTATQLAKSQYKAKQSKMKSPIDGTVLKRYNLGKAWLAAGTKLLQIGDLSKLEVESEVLSQDAQQLHIGDTVLLSSIGSPIILKGKVKRINAYGFTKKSSLGVDEQRVDVITSIEKPQTANLGVDYRLQAKFLIGKANNNALLVPRFSILQDNQGKFYVFKVENKKLVKQIVKLGTTTDSEIAITSGLTKNDTIVTQPTAEMTDGMKI
jgi:RND family efflux transporter MFP subunit